MSSITTPDPDRTPPSGYRTAENRPDPAPTPHQRLALEQGPYAKYVWDKATEHARQVMTASLADGKALDTPTVFLIMTAFVVGYNQGCENCQ